MTYTVTRNGRSIKLTTDQVYELINAAVDILSDYGENEILSTAINELVKLTEPEEDC